MKPATGGIPGKALRRCERKPGDLPPPEHRRRFRGMEQLVHRRFRRRVRLPVALMAPLAALGLLAGCEERRQDAPAADAPAATLVATADYGGRDLLSTRVEPGQSVMRATRGATEVRTAYAGAFVPVDARPGQRPLGHAGLVLLRQRPGVVGGREGGGASTTGTRCGGTTATGATSRRRRRSSARGRRRGRSRTAAGPRWRPTRRSTPPSARRAPGSCRATPRSGCAWAPATTSPARDPAWRDALADPDRAGLTVTIADGRGRGDRPRRRAAHPGPRRPRADRRGPHRDASPRTARCWSSRGSTRTRPQAAAPRRWRATRASCASRTRWRWTARAHVLRAGGRAA